MKRLLLVLAVALIMAAMVATTAAPALAQRLPSGACAGGVVGIMGEPPKDANLCAFVGT
jgi:hypothetical protein